MFWQRVQVVDFSLIYVIIKINVMDEDLVKLTGEM